MKNSDSGQWSGKSRGGSLGYLFFIYLIKYLGVRSAYFILGLVVVYFVPFAPRATRATWHYHRKVLGYGVFRSFYSIFGHYYVFGQTIIDKIAIGSGLGQRYKFEFENHAEFLEILDSPSGAVLVSAHVGNWEIGGEFFGDYASKMNVVMYDVEYQKIKTVVGQNSKTIPYKIIPVNQGGIESIVQMKNAIDAGEYLCFQGDRYVSKSTAEAMQFMGHAAHFPKGPFVIASKFRAPVVFYYATRGRGMRYKFEFTIASRGGAISGGELLDKYLESLEKVVRKHPHQWFNFYKFWS